VRRTAVRGCAAAAATSRVVVPWCPRGSRSCTLPDCWWTAWHSKRASFVPLR
jgi:hypothetical protein